MASANGRHYCVKENNPNWKGGKHTNNGYVRLLLESHPRADCKGYVPEHILIAEKVLGKPLPPEAVVHHVNKNAGNNQNNNLVICENNVYHMWLHKRLRALKTCGHADWFKCPTCKQYDDPKNMVVLNKKRNILEHKECRNNRHRRDYATKKETQNASSC